MDSAQYGLDPFIFPHQVAHEFARKGKQLAASEVLIDK